MSLPQGSIAVAAFRRFLPGAALVFGGFLFASAFAYPSEFSWIQVLIASLEATSLTVGFALGLRILAPFLDRSANVTGRRGVLTGLLSPLALGILSAFTQRSSLAGITVMSVGAGVALSAAMFFPWIKKPSRPDRGLSLPNADETPTLSDATSAGDMAEQRNLRDRQSRNAA